MTEHLYGTQGDIPFEVDSTTSAEAAKTLEAHLSQLEQTVFDLIAAEPRTCEALELASGLSHQTVSARVRGLVLRDRVMDSGTRGRNRSGRRAVIWRVKTAEDMQMERAAAFPLLDRQ